MGKYTSDDNRSMQLNPNNERYYSSRRGQVCEDDGGAELDQLETTSSSVNGQMKPKGDLMDYANGHGVADWERATFPNHWHNSILPNLEHQWKNRKFPFINKDDPSLIMPRHQARRLIVTDYLDALNAANHEDRQIRFHGSLRSSHRRWRNNYVPIPEPKAKLWWHSHYGIDTRLSLGKFEDPDN